MLSLCAADDALQSSLAAAINQLDKKMTKMERIADQMVVKASQLTQLAEAVRDDPGGLRTAAAVRVNTGGVEWKQFAGLQS